MKICIKSDSTNPTLDIQGTADDGATGNWRLVGAALVFGLGILLWSVMDTQGNPVTEDGYTFRFLAVIAFCIALYLLPCNQHTYLDLTERRIVTATHYARFEIARRWRPLTEFSHIVVRHLCHPGGEGPDTYAGGVGLKPADGKAVVWMRNFPTTEDEIPRVVYEFARELQKMTGLPLVGGGEFPKQDFALGRPESPQSS